MAVILRVLLAQRAGGGVARVHEQALPRVGLALVHGLELGDGHVDLAAHLEQGWIRPARLGQLLGHLLNRRHVGGDVLARDAVAPRRRLHEPALLVGERHGDAVDLGLAGERQRVEVEGGVLAPQPLGPGAQLGLVERVVEAHHGHPVTDLLEEARGRGPHGVGGRVGRGELGVLLLQLAQLADEQVVLGVGDLRRVERVVQLVVVPDERRAAPRPAPPRPSWPWSGGDARADHGVGVERVVEGHRLSGRHRPLRVVEAHHQVIAGSTVQGTGRPWALTCATARAPAASGRSTQVSECRARTTEERTTSSARPTVTRRDATSTWVT